MADKKQPKRSTLKKRVRKLETELTKLESGHPSYTKSRQLLEKQIELAKAELRTRKSSRKSSAAPAAQGVKAGKKSPLPGGASFPSFQLPSPKSPTFVEDSVKSIAQLRTFCKQCMGYMARADQMFDTLHGVSSNLHEAGVLPKIMKGSFKEMTTSEWGALLMAILNSPLSGMILGGGSGEGSEEKAKDGDAS